MWLRKVIVLGLILVGFMLSGCSFRFDDESDIGPNVILPTKDMNIPIRAKTPSTFANVKWYYAAKTGIYISRTVPNMYRIVINPSLVAIEKDGKMSKHSYETSLKNYKEYIKRREPVFLETKTSYVKFAYDYIAGIRCSTYVEANSIAYGIGRIAQQINCIYYSTDSHRKTLHIDVDFYSTWGDTKFESSKYPSLANFKADKLYGVFKLDVKEFMDSIKILDIDTKRMRDEGLLYDRKYDINDEFNNIIIEWHNPNI